MKPQKDYASKINNILKQMYVGKGLEEMTKLAEELLKSKQCKEDEEFRNIVHGEVCETVLECYLIDYIKRNNLENQWFYEKGLVLKDMNQPDGEYLTEVDMTLFTPFKILTIECKCYGGGKLLVDECKIVRKGIKPYDVFKQHSKHIETLMNNFRRFRLNNKYALAYSPIDAAYFDFSLGKITDKRSVEWKHKMPALNVENLYDHLDTYKGKPACWNILALRKAVDVVTKHKEILRKKHLKYVKELAKKREAKKNIYNK